MTFPCILSLQSRKEKSRSDLLAESSIFSYNHFDQLKKECFDVGQFFKVLDYIK